MVAIARGALGLLLAVFPIAAVAEVHPRYFTTVRDVRIENPYFQNYVILDPEVWSHARPDLGDLRLYDGEGQVAYQLIQARGGSTTEQRDVKIMNLARVGDHTEFDLDMEGIPEYDHIRLKLDAKNFVASASVQGRDTLLGGVVAPWPSPSTLYDFSAEKLGSNFTIALPTWSFRYVHMKLSRGIEPRQVQGASVSNLQERRAAYIPAGTCRVSDQRPHRTTLSCDLFTKMPVDRIVFGVGSGNINFLRPVNVLDQHGMQFATGEISRIRTTRGGQTVTSENLIVQTQGACCEHFTVNIENGDDPSLDIASAQPQSVQRRVYFNPAARSAVKLYYGDSVLHSPTYDYAKFFKEEPNASQAELSPATQNASYTPRPDERPWSERNNWLMWVAMVLAVVVLGALALRGLRERPST